VYSLLDLDYGDYPTAFSPLYYSFVTLTTLGYGDVVPASPQAQLVAVIEVVVGYVALGGLLSIFATKMARRAE
jgi:voltage-gated potassium channel Kch